MEAEGSLPFWQEPANGSYPRSAESVTCFFKIDNVNSCYKSYMWMDQLF
jgi:hypothetical protein